MGAKNSKSKNNKPSTIKPSNNEAPSGNTFDTLRQLGYSVDDSVEAIAKYSNNLNQCIDYLTSKEKPIPKDTKPTNKIIASPLPTNYETYEPNKYTKSKPSTNTDNNSNFEYNIKEILVIGYIRHVIFILLGNNDDDSDDEIEENIMNIIPLDVIKLCEQYYEANMIMFIIQSCFNQSLLNGIECINLNCKKIIKFRTVSMDKPETLVTKDQHWFDKTVYTYYLPNITIPNSVQHNYKYANILSPIQEPSIILKCKLNSWSNEHNPSMIIFDNRLLHNWNFNNNNNNQENKYNKLLTDLDINTKQIDAFEMKLPTISYVSTQSQLRMFVYSKDYGLLAMDNHNNFTIYRLKFNDNDEKSDSNQGWKWIKLETNSNNKMREIISINGMCVIDSPSLEHGEYEKLFCLSKINENNYSVNDMRDNNIYGGNYNRNRYGIKSMEMEVGYFDIMCNSYRQLCRFNVNSKPVKRNYSIHYSNQSAPETKHKGHQWIQPCLHYNKIHKKVFIGGDDTKNIESYDIIQNKWIFLPQTQYIHSKGCTLWSLDDQSNDILYIDKGISTRKSDNFVEFFDLRSNDHQWRLSDHYMQWKDIANSDKDDAFSRYDYHVYQRTFI